MTLAGILILSAGILLAGLAASWAVLTFWRVRSELQRRAAGATPLQSMRAAIWRDPGPPERLDLAAGPGGRDGAPAPPLHFIEEHDSGSRPCVSVRDARGRVWRVKWGDEVHTETLATRLAWAGGYFVEINYFVPSGRIENVPSLRRAAACIGEEGGFRNARFELDEPDVVKHFDEHSWAWNDNPFVSSRELNGLKIMLMLLSNWDNKDVRDVARGSNTAIFEHRIAQGEREARYLIIDWGAAMGAWGSHPLSRGRWDCDAYTAQSEDLVTAVDGETVRWGYKGQRTEDAVAGVGREDVRWFNQFAGRLTDRQLAAGLRASGATESEIDGFTKALRSRLNRLKEIGD